MFFGQIEFFVLRLAIKRLITLIKEENSVECWLKNTNQKSDEVLQIHLVQIGEKNSFFGRS